VSDVGQFEYLALLGGCVLLTLPLEFLFGARVWRRPRRALRAIAPVVLVFGAWDVAAIALGHWWFNSRFVTGVTLPPGLPLEELAFFVVIPMCGLLTYEAVRNLLSGQLRQSRR
jgi:lycopene cyclase domain-containing protein